MDPETASRWHSRSAVQARPCATESYRRAWTPTRQACGVAQDGVECSICLEPIAANRMIVRIMCGHTFHLPCLSEHISVKCREADARTAAALRAADSSLELEGSERSFALGFDSTLLEMHESGRIRRCPSCDYGPVVNAECSDLQSHDLARGDGSGRTTNGCPNCGFFSASWSEWSVWSDMDSTAAARCPLCRVACHVRPQDIPALRARFDTADWVLSECQQLTLDLLELLSALRPAPANTPTGRGHSRHSASLRSFGAELDDTPGCTLRLLRGQLRDLLEKRLVVARRAEAQSGKTFPTCAQCHEIIRGAPMMAYNSLCDGVVHFGCTTNNEWRLAPGYRQVDDHFVGCETGDFAATQEEGGELNSEILAGAQLGLACEDDDGEVFQKKVQSLVAQREQLLMLLCTVPGEVQLDMLERFGRPWQTDGSEASVQSGARLRSRVQESGEIARLIKVVLEASASICERLEDIRNAHLSG